MTAKTLANEWGLPSWFAKAYRILIIVTLGLIILGGSVRVMNAGLACPDWPLCFGQLIPDFHPQVYFEFIHRALAGLVGLAILVLHFLLLKNKKVPTRIKVWAIISLLLLGTQVFLGGQTVLQLLLASIVAAHLAMGTALFASLVWIYQSVTLPSGVATKSQDPALVNKCMMLLLALYMQVIMGGLVASNYAANACPGEFPTCYGQLFPTLSGAIGLQVMHRTWAYVVFFMSATTYFVIRKYSKDIQLRKTSGMLLGVIVCQVIIGISNVLLYTPPIIAIIHLAFATKILWLAVKLVHRSKYYTA